MPDYNMGAPVGIETIGQPIPGAVVAPKNYADAFNPASDIYSVNTGVATVKQLESIKAAVSTAPPAAVNLWPLFLTAIILFL